LCALEILENSGSYKTFVRLNLNQDAFSFTKNIEKFSKEDFLLNFIALASM
jgi:hypothetical protein